MGKSDQNNGRGYRKFWLAVLAMVIPVVLAPIILYSLPKEPVGQIAVYLTPNCGCCVLYVDYLKRRGFEVEVVEMEDLTPIKNQYGIPLLLQSCHTSVINEYFVEGHVPVEVIKKLLEEKPDVAGVALPGMPSGSPGMPGAKEEPFVIYSFRDGNFKIFTTM